MVSGKWWLVVVAALGTFLTLSCPPIVIRQTCSGLAKQSWGLTPASTSYLPSTSLVYTEQAGRQPEWDDAAVMHLACQRQDPSSIYSFRNNSNDSSSSSSSDSNNNSYND